MAPVSLGAASTAAPLASLPAISDAALPRAVRAGSTADKHDYKVALGFEKVMLTELVKEMTKGTASLSDGPRADAINDAMTDALANAGGIGLAPELYATLKRGKP